MEATINKPQTTISHPLGNSLYLNTDAANDSMALYNSLVTGYKWWNKAHDYAGGAAMLLSQHSLNRSSGKVTKQRQRPRSTSHIAPPHALDSLINQISKLYLDMRFRVTRPQRQQIQRHRRGQSGPPAHRVARLQGPDDRVGDGARIRRAPQHQGHSDGRKSGRLDGISLPSLPADH